ncbi:hypothetical protein D4T97_014660 [Siminovitchia acidinfaciens]|uniref:Uncharacterized protein n=1 Tax=Siminovitchia acidinfaciens TaxID=2321395 RepID=A0A429XX91_9BACI|nr:hypothetical protein [Siminovitchia acidinfaciens]RST73114.1 hypothetical protein D4T97_014660 [Siminovitchia acidinfaciens]
MESKPKSLNRHESLQHLSRQHMVDLHTALKLKRAGEANIRYTIGILKDFHDFWHPSGQNLFREEEEIWLPAIADKKERDTIGTCGDTITLISETFQYASPKLKNA